MIEKLDKKMEFVEISVLGNKKAECLDFEAGRKLNSKINELVDAVNELQAQVAILEEHAHPTAKTPVDPYAEQRKWIGKLCKFWDKDYKDDQWDYGLLQAVEKAETAHIWKTGCFKHNLGHWYDNCEPVKPDDGIIYKGE